MFKQNASTLVFVDEIDPVFNRYQIKVQVVKLWRGYQRGSGGSIEMVLVDEKGTRIHATVEDKLINKFKAEIKEDGAIIIDTFQLVNNGFEYKTSPLPFKISFFRTTLVTPCGDFPGDIPEKYFVDFSKILSGLLDHKILIDVIGRVASVGPIEDITIRGKNNTKLDMELRDAANMGLICTLWGQYADQVKSYADEHSSSQIICVIRFAQIKEFRGNLSISNAFSSTKILFDPQDKFAEEFRLRLPCSDVPPVSYGEGETPKASSVSLYDDFFIRNVRKTIEDIVTCGEVVRGIIDLVCVTIGTVQMIEDPYRWCYLSCSTCNRKVQPYPLSSGSEGPPLYDCAFCSKDVTDVTPRYRLLLRVADGFVETKFIFFDGLAENLIGKSAAQLVKEMPEDDPKSIPPVLSDLVGKRMLFKIKVLSNSKQSKNTYVVQKFADNKKMVEEFESGKTLPMGMSESSEKTKVENVDLVITSQDTDDDSSDGALLSSVMKSSKKTRDTVDDETPKAKYSLRKKVKVEKI